MSISLLIDRLESKGVGFLKSKPASNFSVESAESKLGFVFPNQYKQFLCFCGILATGHWAISGIIDNDLSLEESGNGVFDTLTFRDDCDDFPQSLYVLSVHDDGAYCLDMDRLNSVGENPVVNFEFGAKRYPIVASCFGEFLVEFLVAEMIGETLRYRDYFA
jgi:hypothetical protein